MIKETGLQPEQDTINGIEQIARTEDVESMHDSSSGINIQMNQQNKIWQTPSPKARIQSILKVINLKS